MGEKKSNWSLILLFVVIAVGVVFWAFPSIPKVSLTRESSSKAATSTLQKTVRTTPENAGWNIYKNTAYGFQISYPQETIPETVFKTFYHLSGSWRAENLSNSTGTPIVAFPVYRIENENSYPRYYDAEVRIGVSTSTYDVADCISSNPYTTASSTETVINGSTFYEFPIQNAGMMQYLEGRSFRTVHNGMCFAVEQLRTGSSYRDTTSSVENIDAALRGYFDTGWDIVKTFRFLN